MFRPAVPDREEGMLKGWFLVGFRRIMIHVSSENAQRYDRVKRKGAAFLSNFFKSKKLTLGMKINEDEEMERAPKVETPGKPRK